MTDSKDSMAVKPWWLTVLNTSIIAAAVSLTGHLVSYNIQKKEIEINSKEKEFARDMARMQFNYSLLKDYLAIVTEDGKKEKLMFDYMVMAFANEIDNFAKTLQETETRITEVAFKLESAKQSVQQADDKTVKRDLQQKVNELQNEKSKLEKAATIYRERPFSAGANLGAALQFVPSSREQVIRENPVLKDGILALTGLKVRYGDVIDAITPIYSQIDRGLGISNTVSGARIGGTGGSEMVLEKPGYLITGLILQRGLYFGRDETVFVQVVWQKLGPQGLDPASTVVSERLGSGQYAKITQPPKEYRASSGHYISDLTAVTSFHTSGETFLNDIDIKTTPLPISG